MALTKVQIFNLALSHVGTKSAVSDPDENSEEAERLRAVYDHVRDTVLADHSWPFATVHQALAETGETDSLWIYQYRYPSDCVNFLSILPQSWFSDTSGTGLIFDHTGSVATDNRYRQPPMIPFEVSLDSGRTQRVILTNEPEAVGKYIVKITNEQLFDNLFTDAFCYKLAAFVAPSLTGSDQKVQALENKYLVALSVAKAAKNQEGQPREPRDPPSIQARY